MKRRPRGTGTIEETRDGKFRARFRFAPKVREDIDGSPFETYEEAGRELDAVLAALRAGGNARGGITLRKLSERALAQRDRDGYRAIDGDRSTWDLRVEPWECCGQPASTVTKGDVREWLAGLRREDGTQLATQTRRNALNILRGVFAYGVEHDLIEENPCVGVKVKDHGRTTDGSTFLTKAEAGKLVAVATDPGVALAIGTGMRSGEMRSLLWSDVHADHITVRFGSPETPSKNGKVRDVPLLPMARAALKKLRKKTGGEGKVLPSVTGGFRARGQVFDRLDWKAWLKAAKLTRRVRPHDLRHTCATLLLTGAWGEPWSYEAVKEMLGHSSVKVTERYAKATGTLAQKAAARMKHRPAVGPQRSRKDRRKAIEILERRGSDSNRRMTVLQTQHPMQVFPAGVDVAGLARAYVEAVGEGSPFAIARGLDLAEAVLELGAAPTRLRTAVP